MKTFARYTCMTLAMFLLFSISVAAQNTFTKTFTVPGSFNLACCSTYNYGFSPVLNEPTINGSIDIDSISVSGDLSVTSPDINNAVGFDWEIFVGPSALAFGLPSGQISGSSIYPGSIASSAPTQFRFAEGFSTPTGGNVTGSYNFTTNSFTTNTPLVNLKGATTTGMNFTNGLFVQVFVWSGAVNINLTLSNISVTVTGRIGCNLGLPDSLLVLPDDFSSLDHPPKPVTMTAEFGPLMPGPLGNLIPTTLTSRSV